MNAWDTPIDRKPEVGSDKWIEQRLALGLPPCETDGGQEPSTEGLHSAGSSPILRP